MSAPAAFSHALMQCLIKLETPTKTEAKMELISLTSELMPGGVPSFLEVIKYPMVRDLISEIGKKKMLAILVLLVKDFCSSINVVRNMNEDQMIEAGAMLLDECGNFRLEDYVMMFSLAKRGQLIKILDRIDLQLIGEMMDKYWDKRNSVAQVFIENSQNHYDSLGSTKRIEEEYHHEDAKILRAGERLSATIQLMKDKLNEI